MNDYYFTSHWRVPGTIEEVKDILCKPQEMPRWWPSVFLDAVPVEGAEDAVRVTSRGWLPYTLQWELRPRDTEDDSTLACDVSGDLEGDGIWKLEQQGPTVAITFDWSVGVNKAAFDLLSPILRPLFASDHRWAMRQGEASLRLELARRRAHTEIEKAFIAGPPEPHDDGKFWLTVGAATLGLLLVGRKLCKTRRR